MADGTRATVVVANPDPDVCEVLARLVEAAGHEAIRTTDASGVAAAVAAAQAAAVILDAGAANLDALEELRAAPTPLGASVRVVVVGTGPASARQAWHHGADAVLTRPFASTEVGEVLAASLARNDIQRSTERAAQLAALG